MDPSREAFRVTLFRDFLEDGRASMDFYADCVRDALMDNPQAPFKVEEFTPRLSWYDKRGGKPSLWQMRFERYISYPIQARSRRGGINHIVDHSYGHLVHVLDSRRTVVTVHDVISLLAWRGVIPNHGVRHRPLLAEYALNAAKKAARVVAISENTKRDLVAHLGFRENQISVIHMGLSAFFLRLDDAARRQARASFGFAEDAKIILITGWQHYKNHGACAQAFATLTRKRPEAELRLVRLGKKTAEWQNIKAEHQITEHAIDIEWLSESRLVELYNAADVLFFPSIYEGFGWPPLQAMACGVPVLCSAAGALQEVVSDAAIVVGCNDIAAMVDGLERLIWNQQQRAEYIERGLRRAERFSWRRNAEELSRIYLDLATAG